MYPIEEEKRSEGIEIIMCGLGILFLTAMAILFTLVVVTIIDRLQRN